MYGAIKAHKPHKNYPMRIVVSTIGSPPYETSKYLVDIIQPTLNKNEIRVMNSKSFVEEARQWEPDENEVQVSFDAVNLYPSIPIKKATNTIIDILKTDRDDLRKRTKLTLNDIKVLIELCLRKCYFLWNDQIRILDDAGPIGLSLMVVMAEGYLQILEKNAIALALRSNPPVAPITHRRYVDDTHNRFQNIEHVERFKNILNNQDKQIQFTVELENEQKELTFLDINIKNDKNGKFQFKVHRKDAITNVQIKPHSSIAPNIADGVFKGFLARAYAICSKEYLQAEIEFLRTIFIENGYDSKKLDELIKKYEPKTIRNNDEPCDDENFKFKASLPWIPGVSEKLKKAFKKENIKVTFKSEKNLKTILCSKNKPQLPEFSHPGVYLVPCSCGKKYVGETGASINTRLTQHQKATFENKINESAIAEHQQSCSQLISWDEAEQLTVESNYYTRCCREALEIQRHETQPGSEFGMNKDSGKYVTNKSWIPLLKKI